MNIFEATCDNKERDESADCDRNRADKSERERVACRSC